MSVQSRFATCAAALAALTATLALHPAAAAAQDAPLTVYGDRTILVSFAKLDLGKAGDQRRLRNRVGAAVEQVCLRDIGRGGLQDRGYYACHEQALANAQPQINSAIAGSGARARLKTAAFGAIRVSAS